MVNPSPPNGNNSMPGDLVIVEAFVVSVLFNHIAENLNVIKHPEPKSAIEEWGHSQNVDCNSIQRFVKHGGLLVRVGEQKSLNYIESKKGKESDWK